MIPVNQTKLGRKDGNCMTACIASIIECNIDDIDIEIDDDIWFYEWAKHLESLGWLLIFNKVSIADRPHLPLLKNAQYVIVAGMNRSKTCRHACVAKLWTDVDLDRPLDARTNLDIVHDPSGDDNLDINDVDQLMFIIKQNKETTNDTEA